MYLQQRQQSKAENYRFGQNNMTLNERQQNYIQKMNGQKRQKNNPGQLPQLKYVRSTVKVI